MARTMRHKRRETAPSQVANLPKRPRQDDNKHTASFNAIAPPQSLRSDDSKTFPFLDLPRELRDEIYRHIIESDKAPTLRSRNLMTKCGLVGVNSRIREEFLDAVLFNAPMIRTTVRNHNFAHVVTFLNRLSEAQFQRFQSASVSIAAQVHANGFREDEDSKDERGPDKLQPRKIQITLTYSNTKQSTRPSLNRWLDRFNDPNRRGSEIDFEYKIDRSSWGSGGYKQRPHERKTASSRSNEEARKIIDAVGGGSRGWW